MLDFRIEWLDAPGVENDVLATTWARLEIEVDGSPACQVFSRKSRAVRDSVNTSVYPLAGWLVQNWWSLLHERMDQVGVKGAHAVGLHGPGAWMRRHNLLLGREGMSYPNLTIYREDRQVGISWSAEEQSSDIPVQFIGSGFARVDISEAERALGDLIDGVLERLDGSDDTEVLDLRDEWNAVRRSSTDERELCERLAAIGVDPYAPNGTGDLEELLSEVDFDELMLRDLLAATRPDAVRKAIESLSKWISRLSEPVGGIERPDDLFVKNCNHPMPYVAGYARAARVRQIFGVPADGPIEDLHEVVASSLGVEPSIRWTTTEVTGVDGLTQESNHPTFIGKARGKKAQRFHLARALHHFLYSTGADEPRRLLTRASDWQQACSRAFAAEILAPAAALTRHLQGSSPWGSEVKLAKTFKVSPHVITHQISNHGLC